MKKKLISRFVTGLFAIAAAFAAHAETHAIVIAISDYPQVLDDQGKPLLDEDGNPVDNRLQGPVNDARVCNDYLVKTAGVRRENIVTLLDDKATANGVLAALRKVLAKLTPGDNLLWYFSGHGTQVRSSKETDGIDEGLVLFDYSLFLDDTIDEICGDLNTSGVNTICLFDSCYAGGMDRGLAIMFGGISRTTNSRNLKASSLPRFLKGKIDINLVKKKGIRFGASRRSGGTASQEGANLLLLSSQEDQKSLDLGRSGNQEARGLFSLLFFEALKLEPEGDVSRIMAIVDASIRAKGLIDRQKPRLLSRKGSLQSKPFLAE